MKHIISNLPVLYSPVHGMKGAREENADPILLKSETLTPWLYF